MGMGEPLDNYTHVVNSIKFMTEPNKFALGNHHICISTVGIPHRIKKLSHDLPSTRLALSLHAPDQPTRLKLMPRAASTWKLEKILEATDDFIKQQKKVNSTAMKNIGLLVEYILIKDVNDTRSQAHALGKILKPRADAVLVNLIPYNPTAVPYDYKSEYSIKALVRQTLGQDIDSACGQLVIRSEQEEREKRERKEAEEKGEERGLSSYSYHLPFFFSPSFSCCLKKFDVSSLARKVTGSDRGVALTLASSGGCLLLCFLMMAMMRKRIRER
ncbi:radical sam domain-containing protein [Cystoisospora suis]|uniref:Radical sam domain-containing protein n=1 Tax=Cystoisospora suis TaxID=483139 RepID=A0A2C6K076_9APIC|nr:radical sam domain-containing protein [Cystoisospora suis]